VESDGHTNVWAPTLDDRRGLYLPVSASNDFYGGMRRARISSPTIVCFLDVRDRRPKGTPDGYPASGTSPPSPPNLVSIRPDGRAIEAVVQLRSRGSSVFDRLTGDRPIEAAGAGERHGRRTCPGDAAVSDEAARRHGLGASEADAFDLTPEFPPPLVELKKLRPRAVPHRRRRRARRSRHHGG
jgi:hypothetical protein